MKDIQCNVLKLQEIKNTFNKLNDELLDEIKKMQKEVINLDEILKTPKGDEFIELFNDFMKERLDKFNNEYGIIRKNFDISIMEYTSFLDEIKEMVK